MPRVKTFDEAEVLEKAMGLFWEKGYGATSVQDLVDRLGINRASLYDTYGGKEELFLKAFTLYRQKNTQALREHFNRQPNVRKGIKSLFEQAIETSVTDHERKGCFVVNASTELIPGDETIVTLLLENKKTIENLFYEYLKRGETDNQFSEGKDLRVLASLLFTLYNGLKVVSKVEPKDARLAKSVTMVLSLLNSE